MIDDATIREIAAHDTHDLRRRILRDTAVDASVVWDGDDRSDTIHLGASIESEIVAISTWLVAADPLAPHLDSIQLRGMATDQSMARRGLGRALLDAGTQRARIDGRDRVWANARVTALSFYEDAGWTVTGPIFATATTGLPHRHAHADLR